MELDRMEYWLCTKKRLAGDSQAEHHPAQIHPSHHHLAKPESWSGASAQCWLLGLQPLVWTQNLECKHCGFQGSHDSCYSSSFSKSCHQLKYYQRSLIIIKPVCSQRFAAQPRLRLLYLRWGQCLHLRFLWKDHETAKIYEDRYIFWAFKTPRDDFLITKFSEMPSVPSESMFSPHIIFTSFLSLCMAHMAPESVVLRELMTNPICLIKNLIGSRGIPSGSSPAVHSEVIHGELVILVYQFGVSLTLVPSSNTKLASKCTFLMR